MRTVCGHRILTCYTNSIEYGTDGTVCGIGY